MQGTKFNHVANEPHHVICDWPYRIRKFAVRCLSLSYLLVLPSCNDVSRDPAYKDYVARCVAAADDYRSTNKVVAEEGLLRFREWLINDKRAGEPWFNRDLNLVFTDGRLFSLYEFEGNTNQADLFYQEAVHAYVRFLRSRGRIEYEMTKEELRQRTIDQEKGLKVGWKTSPTRAE